MTLKLGKVEGRMRGGDFISTKELLQYPAIAFSVTDIKRDVPKTKGRYTTNQDGSQRLVNYVYGDILAFDSKGRVVLDKNVTWDMSGNVFRGFNPEIDLTYVIKVTQRERFHNINELEDGPLRDKVIETLEAREEALQEELDSVPDEL